MAALDRARRALAPEGVVLLVEPLAGVALLRETAAAAGFTRVRRLPIEAPLNPVLELMP